MSVLSVTVVFVFLFCLFCLVGLVWFSFKTVCHWDLGLVIGQQISSHIYQLSTVITSTCHHAQPFPFFRDPHACMAKLYCLGHLPCPSISWFYLFNPLTSLNTGCPFPPGPPGPPALLHACPQRSCPHRSAPSKPGMPMPADSQPSPGCWASRAT